MFFNQLSANVKLGSQSRIMSTSLKRNKGKGKCIEDDQENNQLKDVSHENRLATLDIFAGCGGLSEGLQHAGMSNQNLLNNFYYI